MARRAAAKRDTTKRSDSTKHDTTACLKKAAMLLSSEGWNPHDHERSISGALTRAAASLWPNDQKTQDDARTFSYAAIGAKLKARTSMTLDEWEAWKRREPEEVVAIVAPSPWPWPALFGVGDHESAVEAFMVLQRMNMKGLDRDGLVERARAAFPAEWCADGGPWLAVMADTVIDKTA